MKINTAVCLLSLVLLPACSTTRTSVGNPSMEQRKIAKYAISMLRNFALI